MGGRGEQHCFIYRRRPHSGTQPHLGAEDPDCGGLHVRDVWPGNKPRIDKGNGLYPWFHMV